MGNRWRGGAWAAFNALVLKPEALAREAIDEALRLAGWLIQDVKEANVDAGPGVAVREFPLGRYGYADYLLYVDGKAAGIILPLQKGKPDPRSEVPSTLRSRLQHLQGLSTEGLWPAQVRAIRNLELSLAAGRPRALIQMATGSGKTYTAVNSIFRSSNKVDSVASLFDATLPSSREPVPVRYNPSLPIETFDVIFTDECHRSIYNLWRQVLAEITAKGSRVEAGLYVDKRDRLTRSRRWEQLDDDLVYGATVLDRDVVAEDQIRTVLRTFREKLFTEIFPGRKEVPKTIIFAKDDSHADDIVRIARDEFGRGNEFIQKITYRTTGKKSQDLISEFRTGYHPRIAVTVDMIATGTDIKPVEIVMFMRVVRSRLLFEQMKGRGVRVIDPNDFQAVTSDAKAKDRYIVVDCVGLCESNLVETHSLEQHPSMPMT